MVKADGSRGRERVAAPSQRGSQGPSQQQSRQVSSTQPSGRRGGLAASQEASQPHRYAPSTQPSHREDHDEPTQTHAVSDEEREKLVSEVMRHMLFKNHQQPGVPVSRHELIQLITKTYKQRYLPNVVISMAQEKMIAIFGFEMKELQRVRMSSTAKPSNGTAQGDVKEYVLTTTLPEELLQRYVETADTAAAQSLAVLVVGIIKICGGVKVPEETLWQNLQRLGITEDLDHPVFGNIKNALERMAKQRYITKVKMTGNNGDGFVYELAERALNQSFQRRLEEFIAKVVSQHGGLTLFRSPSQG